MLTGRMPPQGPPTWSALSARPVTGPPAMSEMMVLRGVPKGTSIRPGFLTNPETEKILVPLLLWGTTLAYAWAPLLKMSGTFAEGGMFYQASEPCQGDSVLALHSVGPHPGLMHDSITARSVAADRVALRQESCARLGTVLSCPACF